MTTEPLDPAASMARQIEKASGLDWFSPEVAAIVDQVVAPLAAENAALQKRLEAAWERSDQDGMEKISMHVQMTALREQIQRVRDAALDHDGGRRGCVCPLCKAIESAGAALDDYQPKGQQ
jgi:hypothetical protein